MGKKTLYHPVSLNVIRGAFEYCGFELGRIRQTFSDFGTTHATYTVELTKVPKGFAKINDSRKHDIFAECLPREIWIEEIVTTYAGKTKKTTYAVKFHTNLWNSKAAAPIARDEGQQIDRTESQMDNDLSWLVDDKGFGQIEADAHIADQRAQQEWSDIPF